MSVMHNTFGHVAYFDLLNWGEQKDTSYKCAIFMKPMELEG